jgi:hypothetical protein
VQGFLTRNKTRNNKNKQHEVQDISKEKSQKGRTRIVTRREKERKSEREGN